MKHRTGTLLDKRTKGFGCTFNHPWKLMRRDCRGKNCRVPQGNQWHLPNYGTSGSVNGSEGNPSFCDSKIFAHWEPPTSEAAAKLTSRRIWICLESPQKLDFTTISRNTHKVTTFHLLVVTFQITPTQKQKALNFLNSTNTWKARFLPNMLEKHICIKLCLHQLQKPMENLVVPSANPKDKLAWQKGCSLRKGDALRQTSCSHPRHVEGHRQWELGTGKRDLIVQLYFPAQRHIWHMRWRASESTLQESKPSVRRHFGKRHVWHGFANVRDSLVTPVCLWKNSGENFEVRYFIGNSTKLTNSQLWFHSTSLIQIRFVIVNPLMFIHRLSTTSLTSAGKKRNRHLRRRSWSSQSKPGIWKGTTFGIW